MDSRHIDNVKVEKARAMMRYRRLRNIAKLVHVLEVFVALTLLSWSSTRLPTAVRLYGDYLLQLSVSLSKPHIVFLLGNAIVISLLLLSRQHDVGSSRGTGDLYDEYVQNSETRQRTSPVSDGETPAPAPAPATEETTWNDKQIVCLENAVVKTECDAVESAIRQATKEIKRFQRTQSEKLKHELRTKPGRKFRRSETEMHRTIVPGVTKRSISPLDTMDNLNSEEFRRAIEAYIAKHQKSIRMADENE